jgi:hypothetical protein
MTQNSITMLVSSTKPRRGEKQKTQEERGKQNKAKEKGERKRNGTTEKLKKQEGEHWEQEISGL